MADRTISPWLKQTLELGPTVVFFVLYLRLRDEVMTVGGVEYSGFIVATVLFIPVFLVAMAVLWRLTGELSRLQLFTAFMVIFFGALTAWFNDERFFKMKTTIVYGVLAGILVIGLAFRRSYLEYVLSDVLPMTHQGWMMLTRRLALGFGALAVANEILWRNFSTDLWVKVETFGFPIALFLYLWVQIIALQAHFEPESDGADERAD